MRRLLAVRSFVVCFVRAAAPACVGVYLSLVVDVQFGVQVISSCGPRFIVVLFVDLFPWSMGIFFAKIASAMRNRAAL